jgi:hypothetical protein
MFVQNAGSGFSFTLFTFVGAVTGRYISGTSCLCSPHYTG